MNRVECGQAQALGPFAVRGNGRTRDPRYDERGLKAGTHSLTVAPQTRHCYFTAMVTLPAPLLPATETVTGTWFPGATPPGTITFTW